MTDQSLISLEDRISALEKHPAPWEDAEAILNDEMVVLGRIQTILEEWSNNKPSGFFVIHLSYKRNVFVQGTKSNDVISVEAVNQTFTEELSDIDLSGLINLGWQLDDSENYTAECGIQSIVSGELSIFLSRSLFKYNLKQSEIDFTYLIDE
jgi:hypothetical protein